jgi:hypothetical protein
MDQQAWRAAVVVGGIVGSDLEFAGNHYLAPEFWIGVEAGTGTVANAIAVIALVE